MIYAFATGATLAGLTALIALAITNQAQIPDLPQSERALYWVVTLALSVAVGVLFRENRELQKGRVELLEKVLSTNETTNDTIEAFRQALAAESEAKKIAAQLAEIRARLPDERKGG